MKLHCHATLSLLLSELPPTLSRQGKKSWSMPPRLAMVEYLNLWHDGITMAELSIRAGSLDQSPSNPKQNKKEKRHGHRGYNIFNITTAAALGTP